MALELFLIGCWVTAVGLVYFFGLTNDTTVSSRIKTSVTYGGWFAFLLLLLLWIEKVYL